MRSNGRQDVQRLFGHFGLDPADYVVSFARPSVEATSAPVEIEHSFEQQGDADAERDLFDYRNFELTR